VIDDVSPMWQRLGALKAIRWFARGYAREHRREPVMDSDPFSTQRDVGSAVVTELSAAGFRCSLLPTPRTLRTSIRISTR
jgi:hypothetical protein